LTTVQQEQRLVGKSAVEEIIKIIELCRQGVSFEEPQTILLEPTLIERQSSIHPVEKLKEVV